MTLTEYKLETINSVLDAIRAGGAYKIPDDNEIFPFENETYEIPDDFDIKLFESELRDGVEKADHTPYIDCDAYDTLIKDLFKKHCIIIANPKESAKRT